MSTSLSVFKISNYSKEVLTQKKFTTQTQYTLEDIGVLPENLKPPRSEFYQLEYKHDDAQDVAKYSVKHISDTILRPIRIILSADLAESMLDAHDEEFKGYNRTTTICSGYQKIDDFEVIIDFKKEELYVFSKRDIAHSLIRRMKKDNILNYEHTELDLSRIDEISLIENVWGVWANGDGACSKKGFFGQEIHRYKDVEQDKVTSYNVKFHYNDEELIDLTISKDGRISTHSGNVTNKELYKIYLLIKGHLTD